MKLAATRAKPLLLALSLVALLGGSVASAQSSKEDQIARMLTLQAQIDALKPQRNADADQQLNALRSEFNQISASMGGDVPCNSGASPAGSSAARVPAPSPTGCAPTTTAFTQSTAVAIPTGPGVVTSTIVVSDVGPYLWDVDATTFITHTFAADLDVTITSPAGTVVTLTTDNGAGNDNVYNGTVWDDSANPAGQVPYTTNNGLVTDQAYTNLTLASPLVPEESMAAFTGEDPNGTWTITVSDDLAGDGGSLDSWSLNLTTFANPVITDPVVTATQATAVAIPTGPAVVTSTLAVAGLTNPICKVVLRTNIQHTFASDIDATLTSPTGTVVTLTTDNGAGNDNVYDGTTWDDKANPAGQVPYTNNNGMVTDQLYVNLTTATPLVAEESMGAFLGEAGNGTWTLTISDDLAGDGGNLNSWSLDFTTCTCSQADLAVALTDAPDPVNAGTNLVYTATSSNNGPSAADALQISLPLPAPTTFVSATPSAGGSCTAPAVGATGTVTCTWPGPTPITAAQNVIVTVAVPANATGNLSATATTTSATLDPTPGNNSATTTTAISASSDLSITLADAPDPVSAGSALVYTAVVNNAGPSDATGVTVTLPVPANTTFNSGTVSTGGSCAGSPVVCTLSSNLAAGASSTITLNFTVSAAAPNGSTINAAATAGSTSTDPNGGNNNAAASTLVNTNANLALTFTASATQTVINLPVTFTATSQNLGPSDAQDVNVTITLSPDFRFSSYTASAGATCTTPQVGLSGAISCTWTGATTVGAIRTLEVNAYSFTAGTSSIQASTSSPTTDPVLANNTLSQSVQVGNLVEGIPTLDRYNLMLLALVLGLMGVVVLRRKA